MSDDTQRSRLGRGLAALIGEVQTETDAVERARGQRRIPIEFVAPNPNNPRRSFNSEDLEDLTQSVRSKGIVQPILVRPTTGPQEPYEIIAGERRWRAAQKAGLTEIPVLIVELNDREALEVAIVENVQRADLNPVEEASGYQKLIDEFGYTQADLAEMIGKSRSHVANTLRLQKLPDSIKNQIEDGILTAGHARALITADDPEVLARQIVENDMSVRDAESLVRDPRAFSQAEQGSDYDSKSKRTIKGRKSDPDAKADADTRMLENQLSAALGLKVIIRDDDGKGEVRIAYGSLEQLDAVCARLRD